MEKKFILGFVVFSLFLSIFNFTGCSRSGDSERIDLSTGWEYSLVDPAEDSSKFYQLLNSDLANLEKLVPNQYGTIWLKKTFDIPENMKGEDLACFLGRISLADNTYLNGSLIGHEGRFPPNEFTAWNTARFYEIPELALQETDNELLVEIFVNGEGSIVSGPFIGLYNDAKVSAEKEKFYNSSINFLFAFFMLIIAIYHFIVFLKNRNETESFFFGLINLITAIYLSVFYFPDIPSFAYDSVSFLWFQKILSSAMPFFIAFIVNSFVNAYFGRKDKMPVFLVRLIVLLLPVFLIIISPDYVHLRALRNWTQYLLVIPLVYVAFIIVKSVVQKQKDAVPLLIGFSPFVLMALLDVVLHDLLGLFNLPYFSPYGWQLVIIALLFVLANRFSNARTQAEYLNIHLADEVETRTKELTESNNMLTEVNSQLESAKVRADRDMKMAVYVQQSFFPRTAPIVEGWDIAYTFKPMAGVSGDLYDFFTEKRKFNGLALFDVSGHGIASGLVTMLAKSVIEREFTSKMDVHLGKVMKDINDSIVSEKGNVENYLTGLLVRVKGEKVEYINAGHPAVFVRSGKTGKVTPVELKNNDSTSNGSALVGIAGMDVDFKVIGFNMNPGDSLIMYTDCLSESRNAAGDEFGQKGISEAFANSGNGSAQAKLDKVINDFTKFTEGVPLNDDLTVIVLQKL